MAETVRDALKQKTGGTPESSWVVTWTGLDSDDSGDPVEMVSFSDRSVQFTGTFGVGGTAEIQGSNNGTDWVPLDDAQGTAISLTDESIVGIGPLCRYIRPLVTAGDGATALVCTLLVGGPVK